MRPRHLKVEDVRLALPKLSERDRAKTEDLLERWSAVNNQVEKRMAMFTRSLEKLHTYSTLVNNEETWLTETEQKIHVLGAGVEEPQEKAEGMEERMEELTVNELWMGEKWWYVRVGCRTSFKYVNCNKGWKSYYNTTMYCLDM